MTIITGGVMPITLIEVIVTILLMFPTAALFAYIITEVGNLRIFFLNLINILINNFYIKW